MNIGLTASFVVILLAFFYTWTLWRKVEQGALGKKDLIGKAVPAIVVGLIGVFGMFYFFGTT